jgi:hypothetical protein
MFGFSTASEPAKCLNDGRRVSHIDGQNTMLTAYSKTSCPRGGYGSFLADPLYRQ